MKTLKILIILVGLGMVGLVINQRLSAQFSGGSGTASNPYLVSTAADLNNVRNYPNAHFLQTADIDLDISPYNSGSGWNPIGSDQSGSRFTGTYDGNDHIIYNLYINRPNTPNVGLFSTLGIGGTIKKIGINGVNVSGARGTGALVGRVRGDQTSLIEFAWANNGTVTGDGATGGLVGANNSVVELPGSRNEIPVISKSFAVIDVYFSGKESAGKDKFGGLVGCNQRGYSINSFARGNVYAGTNNGTTRVGGLAGCTELRGVISSSYSTGEVIGDMLVGGLLGNLQGTAGAGNDGIVEFSYWNIETSGMPTSAGGTGLTTSEMTDPVNFDGFNFETIWSQDPEINDGYPYLFNPGNILPVLWLTFDAGTDGEKVTLLWTTASEWNNEKFEIERSDNLKDWLFLGEIPGSGTTDKPTNYEFEDSFPEEGLNYYRIRQVDFNRNYDYSPVRSVYVDRAKNKVEFAVFPNPATDLIHLKGLSGGEPYQIDIHDQSGKLVMRVDGFTPGSGIQIGDLRPGMYILSTDGGQQAVRFLVVD